MPEPLQIALIRHGQSYANRDGSSDTDSPLTELGIEQAKRLGPWLAANFRPVAIYGSPMTRALRTAEIASRGFSVAINVLAELCEVEFELKPLLPAYESPSAALASSTVLLERMSEDYARFVKRTKRVFGEIIAHHSEGTVLVFSHGGVISTLLRVIFGAHQVSVYADNTSVMLLRWENSRWYVVYTNRTEHLL